MTKLAAAAFFVLASCGSRSRYAELPGTVNGPFSTIRATVAPVFRDDVSGSADDVVASACKNGIQELEPLRDVDFHDRSLALPAHAPMVQEVVATLLEHHDVRCPEQAGAAELHDCRAWCIERWSALATAVERVRAAAARDGVTIESLRLIVR